MDALVAEGLALRDSISFLESRDGDDIVFVQVRGSIECPNDVLIKVDKFLDVRRDQQNRHQVKGKWYVYHAWFREGKEIIRYDTCHGFDDLHRHYVSRETGEEVEERIELERLPTLSDFVRQAVSVAGYMRELGYA